MPLNITNQRTWRCQCFWHVAGQQEGILPLKLQWSPNVAVETHLWGPLASPVVPRGNPVLACVISVVHHLCFCMICYMCGLWQAHHSMGCLHEPEIYCCVICMSLTVYLSQVLMLLPLAIHSLAVLMLMPTKVNPRGWMWMSIEVDNEGWGTALLCMCPQ